jgi:lipoprotein-anchoring transpeptidase ErfK/SrfK
LAAALAQTVGYHLEATKPLSRFTSNQLALLAKLNHADRAHLTGLKHVIVPDRWDPDELVFSPMPQIVPELSDEKKTIVVDLASQVFGAFESGKLVRWGPVSSGDRQHQTPSGTYHLNWHARVRISSENPDWIMPWYFNFSSSGGMGLHQYALPGRPASHGCIRMLAVDARWLFDWGEGWTLGDDGGEVLQEGTLVLVLGSYDFGAVQPWLQPDWWAVGVTLPLQQTATAK